MAVRIIIYSSKSSDCISKHDFENVDGIDVCSNISSLITRLNMHKYNSCLIDSELINNGSELLEIVRTLIDYNIPIMIKSCDNVDHEPADQLKSNDRKAGVEVDLIRMLTATISHEINSPLQAISSNIELLKNQAQMRQASPDKLDSIDHSVTKIRRVMRKLLELEEIRFKNTAAGKMIDLSEDCIAIERPNLSEIISE